MQMVNRFNTFSYLGFTNITVFLSSRPREELLKTELSSNMPLVNRRQIYFKVLEQPTDPQTV